MTSNSSPSPESPKNGQGLKSLIVKGTIGAISLAGTTAIPLVVQRQLTPPTPAVSPSPSISVQASPSPSLLQASPSPSLQVSPSPSLLQVQSDPSTSPDQIEAEDDKSRKEKRRGRRKED
jgi:hypothetical protein